MGDKQGHPFRGNQYTAAQSAAMDRLHSRASAEAADRRIGIEPSERERADVYNRKSDELRRLSTLEHDLKVRGKDVPPELSARVKQVATELVSKDPKEWTPVGGGKSEAELSGEIKRIAANALRPGETPGAFVQRQLAKPDDRSTWPPLQSEAAAREEAEMGARMRAGYAAEEAGRDANRAANIAALNLTNPHESGVPKPVFDKNGRVTNLGEMERAARALPAGHSYPSGHGFGARGEVVGKAVSKTSTREEVRKDALRTLAAGKGVVAEAARRRLAAEKAELAKPARGVRVVAAENAQAEGFAKGITNKQAADYRARAAKERRDIAAAFKNYEKSTRKR
jgi:hypothetical protein